MISWVRNATHFWSHLRTPDPLTDQPGMIFLQNSGPQLAPNFFAYVKLMDPWRGMVVECVREVWAQQLDKGFA